MKTPCIHRSGFAKCSISLIVLGTAAISCLFMSCPSEKQNLLLYVGTYTGGAGEGIYCYEYNPVTGDLVFKNVTQNKANPSFLAIDRAGTYLYAVSEVNNYKGIDSGSVISYKILSDGVLEKISQQATRGKHPCHVTVSPDGKTVVAANYTSGHISIYDVGEDGGLSEVKQLISPVGSGPDSSRQKGPHAHSALFTADGKTLVTADLGTDKINLYEYSPQRKVYEPCQQPFVSMEPGAGPRHFDFSADGRFIYVMNEMASTVSVLQRIKSENGPGTAGKADSTTGKEPGIQANNETAGYKLIETISSLPAGYTGERSGADIHVGPDGRFVYCSNRGHNSIAVFSRDEDSGLLSLVQYEPVQGNWPRNFAIAPDGRYLLVANERSNDVTVFSIDKNTGKLSFTGKRVEIPSPVCLKFYGFAS